MVYYGGNKDWQGFVTENPTWRVPPPCAMGAALHPHSSTILTMTTRFRILVSTLLGVAALTVAVPTASAQAPAVDHPAVKVVNEYLNQILTRQWKKSADIVDEASMKVLKDDYVARIKQARTMDDEEAMVKRVGKASLEEVTKMSPREWYSAYNDGLRERYNVPEERLAEIRRTIKLKTMSVAEDEGGRMVHILVKASYSTGEAAVERLDLTTLRNNGGKWQVVLDGQAPKITPLNGGAAPAGPAPVDPVKPAPAPPKTTKPAPAKPKRPN